MARITTRYGEDRAPTDLSRPRIEEQARVDEADVFLIGRFALPAGRRARTGRSCQIDVLKNGGHEHVRVEVEDERGDTGRAEAGETERVRDPQTRREREARARQSRGERAGLDGEAS